MIERPLSIKPLNTLEPLRSDIPWKIISEVEQEVLGKESRMIKPFQFSIDRATEKGIEKGIRKGRKEGIEKGIRKGRKEGIEKGIEKGIEDVALNMLKEGMNVSQVSKITGMSKDKIKALQIKKAS